MELKQFTEKAPLVIQNAPNSLLQRACACGTHLSGSGSCAACQQKEQKLQRAAVNQEEVNGVPPIVHEVLGSSGQPLDNATRGFMESRFGHDFSGVRVYTDARAAESAQSVNALAYTVGNNVVFGTGQYMPRTNQGNKLLAHELTHVVQQSYNNSTTGIARFADTSQISSDSEAEKEASQMAQTLEEPLDNKSEEKPACPCNPPILKGEDCASKGNDKIVMKAFTEAAGWLPNAQAEVQNYLDNPTTRQTSKAAATLENHFSVPKTVDGTKVALKLSSVIKNTLNNITQPICSHCPDTCGSDNKDAKKAAAIAPFAWKKTNCYTFCPGYFNFSDTEKAKVALHEMMHSWESMGDAVYENEGSPAYPPLTPIALTNADSFASAIRDMK